MVRAVPVAAADEAHVLDGVTLYVRVRLPRSAWDEEWTSARLTLVGAEGGERVAELRRESASTASCALSLTGLGERPGTWTLGVRVDGGGTRPLYGLPTGSPPARCPESGASFTLRATARGRLALAVAAARPRAYVTRVVHDWHGLTVSGRLNAASSAGAADAVDAVVRWGSRRVPVSVESGRFAVTITPGEGEARGRVVLVLDPGEETEPMPLVAPPGVRPAGLPARPMTGADGRLCVMRADYTGRGHLRISCSQLEETT